MQLSNALEPISVKLSGRVMLDKLEQPKKAESPIFFTLLGREISSSLEQLANAVSPISTTLSGTIISSRFSRATNSPLPILVIPFLISIFLIEFFTFSHGGGPVTHELYPGISPFPEIVSVPSLSSTQVRLSPQVPDATVLPAANTPTGNSDSAKAKERTHANNRFFISFPPFPFMVTSVSSLPPFPRGSPRSPWSAGEKQKCCAGSSYTAITGDISPVMHTVTLSSRNMGTTTTAFPGSPQGKPCKGLRKTV